MKNIKVLGIDLAKNVFQLHGTDASGKAVLRKRLTRQKMIEFLSNLTPCLIGIEACTGAHHWARLFTSMGHTVKMMAPQFVKPYVRSNKNDMNDARGIAEAVTRPDMKFVPIKKIEQQEILLIHKSRELVIKQRTAQSNQIRGFLAEFGVVIPKGLKQLKNLTFLLETNKDRFSSKVIEIFNELYSQFNSLDQQVKKYDEIIENLVGNDPLSREILKIEGIGPISASAVIATIGDAKVFRNGREVSAWLGLVPKQYSSGNKICLGKISKRGDHYIRKLLIHGARAALKKCEGKMDAKNKWAADKKSRCGYNKAAVALANKNARVIWALMATGECYRQPV